MRGVLPWLLVVPVALWTVARLLGLERGYPLVALMAFTPYAAAAAILITGLVALLRARAAALVAGACAVVLVGLVAPRALGGPSGARGGDGRTITVLSVNLRFGGADPAAIRALARDADVVSLQELTPEAARTLRDLLPYHVVRAAPRASGTALFARFPLRAEPVLPNARNRQAAARAQVGGTPIELVAVHPPPPRTPGNVAANAREVPALPPATGGVVRILAGDFNTTLDHRVLRHLLGTGYEDAAEQLGAGLKPTWPIGRRVPPVTIDHVLADARCGFAAYRVRTVAGTDHRAILARVVLPRAG